MNITCNICGSNSFKEFGSTSRLNALCLNCNSLERHRSLHYVLKNNINLNLNEFNKCLHISPEKAIHDYLINLFKGSYFATDLEPKKYNHAKCIKLKFPKDFEMFPDNYFDFIIHNHVLEHFPGKYKDHINEFYRLLNKNGIMIFTIPDFNIKKRIKNTIEDGELLNSDLDRINKFGQKDHYKIFGLDLIDYLQLKFSYFKPIFFEENSISVKIKNKYNASGIVFWCQK